MALLIRKTWFVGKQIRSLDGRSLWQTGVFSAAYTVVFQRIAGSMISIPYPSTSGKCGRHSRLYLGQIFRLPMSGSAYLAAKVCRVCGPFPRGPTAGMTAPIGRYFGPASAESFNAFT